MDLLGSILNSMDGPPKQDEKQKQLIKSRYSIWATYSRKLISVPILIIVAEHKEQEEKARQYSKNEMNKFQKFVEERIGRFVNDDRKSIAFQPLDKIYRAIM